MTELNIIPNCKTQISRTKLPCFQFVCGHLMHSQFEAIRHFVRRKSDWCETKAANITIIGKLVSRKLISMKKIEFSIVIIPFAYSSFNWNAPRITVAHQISIASGISKLLETRKYDFSTLVSHHWFVSCIVQAAEYLLRTIFQFSPIHPDGVHSNRSFDLCRRLKCPLPESAIADKHTSIVFGEAASFFIVLFLNSFNEKWLNGIDSRPTRNINWHDQWKQWILFQTIEANLLAILVERKSLPSTACRRISSFVLV